MTTRVGARDTPADVQLRDHLDSRRSFVMVAGAGSGKTTSLVKALAHIAVVHGKDLKMRGQKVACITYTDIARDEIWKDVGESPLFQVSTIHTFLWTIIKPFREDIRSWVKARIGEKIVIAQAKIDKPTTQALTKEKARGDILRYNDQLARIDAVTNFKYSTGGNYAKGILGHDDVIKAGPELLLNRPLLRKIISRMYPYIFVDESQDTIPSVVSALTAVQQEAVGAMCLGFFGDQMQKIYTTGIGELPMKEDWERVEKPENFRCPPAVLDVINNIRAVGDNLRQTPGKAWADRGRARMFIAPRDNERTAKLAQIRALMAEEHNDPDWLSDERQSGVRVLVIVHRMAAIRLGFVNLFEAFNDHQPSVALKEGFQKGTGWALLPFLNFLLPLRKSQMESDAFGVITLLRKNSPLLAEESLRTANSATLLGVLKNSVVQLTEMIQINSGATVESVMRTASENGVLKLDPRWNAYLNLVEPNPGDRVEDAIQDEEEVEEGDGASLRAFLACPVGQLLGYQEYVTEESPFATQHGIKGSEFQRVIAILDDDEGSYNLYSYDKFFGIEDLSDADEENVAAGSDSVIGRTRRLFYVSCSRATHDLAVVLFADDPQTARDKVAASGIFPGEDIQVI